MLQTEGILKYNKNHMGDPCDKYITDFDFLKHMIPHHQVAINASKRVLKYSQDPNIIYLARNIIFGQTREILFMENVLMSYIPNSGSNDKYKFIKIPNQYSLYYPKQSRADLPQCNIHHFDPDMMGMHNSYSNKCFTDEEFMHHMIPHHDVAIEMSERVIKYSKKPLMIDFAYGIIKNQRYEIWTMKQYLTTSQKHFSPIFKNKSLGFGIEGFSLKQDKIKICIILIIIYIYISN